MLQVTDDLIRNVVQEVLGHMKKSNGSPGVRYSEPLGSGTWGVFDNVDAAASAAAESQRKFEAMGLDARRKAVACVRKICIDKAQTLGLEEFEERGSLIPGGSQTPLDDIVAEAGGHRDGRDALEIERGGELGEIADDVLEAVAVEVN